MVWCITMMRRELIWKVMHVMFSKFVKKWVMRIINWSHIELRMVRIILVLRIVVMLKLK